MALDSPPSRMYDSTNSAETMIATASGMPSSASSTNPSAYRFTPAIRTDAVTKMMAFTRCVLRSNRRRRYSGTDRTREP